MTATRASRGEVWLVDLDPAQGHEQAGRRPALVVSVDAFNHGPRGLVVVLPITSRIRHNPMHVEVEPTEGGVRVRSAILCEHLRSIATERLHVRWGMISQATLAAVEDRLRMLLGL